MGLRFDANGEPIQGTAPPPRRMPRQMRPVEQRLQDPNEGVREQAAAQLRAQTPKYDENGEPIALPGATDTTTNPNALYDGSMPQIVPERPQPQRNIVQSVAHWAAGAPGEADPNVGEIGNQFSPEQADVHWQGGPLSGLLNMLPHDARTWLDARGRDARVGIGFVLDPNERSRLSIIAANEPEAEFRRDQYGNVQVRLSPRTPWGYVNRPGASAEDALLPVDETTKFVAASRIPGLRAAAAEPFLTSAARAAITGGLAETAGQGAATAVGGRGPDAGDIAVATIGAGAGQAAGHVLGGVLPKLPGMAADAARAIGDRLPGGAERAAARDATAAAARQAAIDAAREHAATVVRANAQQLNLTGAALEQAVRDAEESASAAVAQQFDAPAQGSSAQAIDQLARSFGVRLAKAQTEGDVGGMQFLYEAAGGMHGAGAQREAAAFLAAQNRALPAAIRAIAGDQSITSPQAAINTMRTGLENAQEAAQSSENQAWRAFNDHADANLRTFDVTPKGNPGGVTRVRNNMLEALRASKVFMDLPEYASNYPQVQRVLALTNRMAQATRDELPIHDVDRVIQLKRFIDAAWENADTRSERAILTQLGGVARDWLRDAAGISEGLPAHLRVRAPQTAALLREALQVSQNSIRAFRENPIIAGMLERQRPTGTGGQPGHLLMTDQEVATRLYGGGEAGLNVSGDGLQALRVLKETLGPSSREWEALRQGALQRLTRGLDDAIQTNQTPAILTTFKRIDEAFRRNGEAMQVLFSPQELARLREAQRVVAAMAPTPRNPANPTNSGITAARAARGILEFTASALKNVPFARTAVNGLDDTIAGARVHVETQGAPSQSFNIARRVAYLWNARQGLGPALGSAAAQAEAGRDRSRSERPYAPADDESAELTPDSELSERQRGGAR